MSSLRLMAPLIVAFSLLVASPASAEWQRHEISGNELHVGNLVGSVECIPHEGQGFVVEARIGGDDAADQNIEFDSDKGRFYVFFPVEDHDRYIYPSLGRRSRSKFNVGRSGQSRRSAYWGEMRDRGLRELEVRGSGRGVELFVDLRIHVPKDGILLVENGIGELMAENISGELELRVFSGEVRARGIRGALMVDTGSGEVTVEDVEGELGIDTGSGSVECHNWTGRELEIDTGSGSVQVGSLKGERVGIDTGSGSVGLEGVDAQAINIDTGSGSVSARRIISGSLIVDTGSGSVRLELDGMGEGPYRVDTGSGGITLSMPADASVDVQAETGSGGIHVDIDDAQFSRKKRDEVEFIVRDGKAKVSLDSGSGSVRIANR